MTTYVTVAIPYVNAQPHLGYAYELVLADTYARCAATGDLYKRAYEGDYCVGCEQFYTAADLVGGLCPQHGTPAERVAEENWFFRLSAYQDHLERLVGSGELVIEPEPFRQEVLGWLRRGVQDFSVSRSVARARGWGIGVLDDRLR